MSSIGADTAVVAKHPGIARQSSSVHGAEGKPSPYEPSGIYEGSSRLRRTTSSSSSASRSQANSLPAGGLNSRIRAEVRMSQLERLKAHRQCAQASRATGQTARWPATDRTGSGERPGSLRNTECSSMPAANGLGRDRQRSASKGYLDRYAAACAASRKTASPLEQQDMRGQPAQSEKQVSTGGGDSTGSAAAARLSSVESRTGTSDTSKRPQQATKAASYNLAEDGEQESAAEKEPCCSDAALLSSHASLVSQLPRSADGQASTSEASVMNQLSGNACGLCMESVNNQAGPPGLPEEQAELRSKGPQAPGRAKPLPQADAPVRSPQIHAEGSHASSASPARLRSPACTVSPLPAPGSAGALFVQPPPDMDQVHKVVGTLDRLKNAGQVAPAQPAISSLQRLVNLHVYAAATPNRQGDATQQPFATAAISDHAHARAASLDGQRSPLPSVEEGPARQFWEVQKKVSEVSDEPSQLRPRCLPKFWAGLCGCFVPRLHATLTEPVAMHYMTPSLPGSGEIFSAALDCSEAIQEEALSTTSSQPAMEVLQPQLPAVNKMASTAAASLPKQASHPTAHGSQASLSKAAQEQGSAPASLPQQQQQESSMPAHEGGSSWLPPPDQELVPFVSSTMALFNHALPSGSDLADAASQDSAGTDRVEHVESAGEGDKVAEEENQAGATLQTQTSLAELLHSEDSARAAPVQCPSEKTSQGRKEDVNKWFLPGSGTKNGLRAFLERQHPGMPSALLDPKAPAPWRSSPSRISKPSPKQAPAPAAASSACPKEGSPPGRLSNSQGQGSPLHVPIYLREGSPANAAMPKSRGPKQKSWKQTQAWSPAKTSIALVKGTAKHLSGAAISITCTPAPGQAAELAIQRAAATDTSAPGQSAHGQDRQPPKQATPARKRAVRATISQLGEVSQSGRTDPVLSPSTGSNAQKMPAAPEQTALVRSGRTLGGRGPTGADTAKARRYAGRVPPGQRMPHLQAAMSGPGLRTNALLDSGGSMGSGRSMQGSRIAMQSIGEAQRAASQDRSRSVASMRAPAGTRSSGVTSLERQVLQQYLRARQQRDKAAAERGMPSPSRRYSSGQALSQQPGMEAGAPGQPESSLAPKTGLSASLEAELRDLERQWEDLDRANAQDAAQAQPTAHGMEGCDEEDKQLQAQKKVASVIERWESRSISADALQHMRERASAGRHSCSDGSASDAVPAAQDSKEGVGQSPTYETLDMLQQLSSPAEKLAVPGLQDGASQPGHSSKVSTDMESICEARMLPDSHSPLSSATSSLSHRGSTARSAEKLPFASDSSLMAAVTAAASPGASLPQGAALITGLKPQKLADPFSTAADDAALTGSLTHESFDSSERSLIAAHPDQAAGEKEPILVSKRTLPSAAHLPSVLRIFQRHICTPTTP